MLNSRFARRAGAHFAKLAGLYALYACWRFFADFEATPYLVRAIMIGSSSAFGLAVLAPPAAFAAAVNHFDLFGETAPETRKRDWKWLALLGLGACLLIQLGIPFWEYLLLLAAPEHVREWPIIDSIRLLLPVAVGTFVVIAGIAGAAISHATQRWSPLRRIAGRWLGATALMVSFAVPLHFFGWLARMEGYPAVLIPLGAPLLPLIAACALVRSRGYGLREIVGLDRRFASWLDTATVGRLVTAVIQEDRGDGPSLEEVAQTQAELDAARFLRGLRRVAGPVARVTEAEARETIAKALAEVPAQASRPRASEVRPLNAERLGEFGIAWAVLSAGLMLLGLLQGVSPQFGTAVAVGLVGAAAHIYMYRHSRNATPVALVSA